MKKRGRPRKNGVKGPEHLARAFMVMNAYPKARAGGLKHSDAIREAVTVVKSLHPERRISETEAKRILAEFRSPNSPIELKVNYSVLEGEEAAERRRALARMVAPGTESTAELTDQDLRKPLKIFEFGFGERTNYPRHNAKPPNPNSELP